ncbi:hypothetical protein [Sphingomonas sp. 2R-10]|uniref:hypothetical protein n=1 Tax=Sphingomonas sp. 2R-10 TaxID=3045148 RepID=UPI0013DDB46F|nr:hypothetical protein [Sphingomonas sp. 2R-10]
MLVSVTALFAFVAWGLATCDAATFPLFGGLGGAVLAKLFAEAGRRRHDRGEGAATGALVLVGTLLALAAIVSRLIEGMAAIAVGVVAVAVVAVTFLRPGQTITNRHGEPPSGVLGSAMPDVHRTDRSGIVWAIVSIMGCAALGLAVQMTTDRIRADRERRAEVSPSPRPTAPAITGRIAP